MPTTGVCIAGATGWAGSELARGLARTSDLTLTAAVARSAAGRDLGDVLGDSAVRCPIYADVVDALARPCDVFVEYTKPEAAQRHIAAALAAGVHVVVGTSGLTEADYAELDATARVRGRAVLAVANFALTVVLLQKFSEMAAKLIPQWEIMDYAHDAERDAPSGTARELASRLSAVRHPEHTLSLDDTTGERASRGATLGGTQVHSVRLPGFVISAERDLRVDRLHVRNLVVDDRRQRGHPRSSSGRTRGCISRPADVLRDAAIPRDRRRP